jgi:uncharacterized protein with NRDE domain
MIAEAKRLLKSYMRTAQISATIANCRSQADEALTESHSAGAFVFDFLILQKPSG